MERALLLGIVSVIASLLAIQVPTTVSDAGATTTIALTTSDFAWFSTSTPKAVELGGSSWLLPEPQTTPRPGHLSVDDSTTVRAYLLDRLSFSTTFPLENRSLGQPSLFGDEMVIFAATDTTTYHGFEFGVRDSLQTNDVYAYYQFPLLGGGVAFHEERLFLNDGRPHSYVVQLSGPIVLFLVDGTLLGEALFPTLPPSAFHVVATAHRASGGWDSAGLALVVISLNAEVSG